MFNFGGTNTAGTANATTTAGAAPSFASGTLNQNQAKPFNLSFGTGSYMTPVSNPVSAAPPLAFAKPNNPNFSFGSNTASTTLPTAAVAAATPAATPSMFGGFSTPTTTATAGFTLGTTPATTTMFSLSTITTTTTSTGLSFGLGTGTPVGMGGTATGLGGSSTGLGTTGGLGATPGLGATSGLGATPGLGAAQAGLGATPSGLGGTPTGLGATSTGLGATSTSIGGIYKGTPLGLDVTSTALGGTSVGLGGATTVTPSTGFSIGGKLSTPVAATITMTGTTVGLPIPTSGTQPPLTGALNFSQLEEVLNKWTMELEEQGKVFINQALQLNAWDRLVIANGEKILNLNGGIEKIKQQQQQLDHELDFILAQQRELEDCIVPLENELKDIPIADRDRNHTYQMAENMDTQLKQMSEDLKEIIEHLNETNKSEDNNNPVAQIGRILNAHMNSLQWIDRNTAQITTLLDQITKMHDMHRRDNERSFHLTYE